MGAISFNLDVALAQELTRLLPISLFVETGTFRGETLEQMHPLFKECISIEFSDEHFQQAQSLFQDIPHVQLYHGDSSQLLAKLNSTYVNRDTLFWLDAHWCAADNTAGEKSQCPLLSELNGIGALRPDSAVLIDDARLFLSPPPKPHEISDWPTLAEVLQSLSLLSSKHTVVYYNDVLMFLPTRIISELRPFLQENTYDLLTLADKARAYDTLLDQAKEKDSEIKQLTEETKRRQEEIHRLNATVIQNTSSPTQAFTPDLVDKVVSLNLQLDQSKACLKNVQAKLRILELATGSAKVSDRPFPFSRQIKKWQYNLAKKTPHPLAKLRQYAPRPIKQEHFPKYRTRTQWPRICVITPSYQQAPYLEHTIKSVLSQNYPNLAYGIQDGGSTDGSAQIISDYLPQLSHAESCADKGQADAIKRGFEKLYPTQEDIMGWLNSDDLLMQGVLKYVGNYFSKNPDVDVIYGHRVIIDDQNKEIGRWFMPPYRTDTLKLFDLVPQETMFWRAHCYEEIGGIDPSFQFALDWDLLLRFEQAGFNIRRLPRFMGCFRAHPEQKTSSKIQSTGEQEMAQLRRRTLGRDVSTSEIHRGLTAEINRSAMTEWLHRHWLRC